MEVQWVLGDLQGCVRALEQFVSLSRFDPGRDELWCLGDLINKGPHSLETLRLWRDLGGHAVLGNHEIYAILCAQGRRERKSDTLDGVLSSSEGQDLLGELAATAPILTSLPDPHGERLWLVHAGLHPAWSTRDELEQRSQALMPRGDGTSRLQDPDVYFATRVRCCTADGEMSKFFGHPRDCPAPFRPWDDLYRGPDRVIHGHWAMRGHYIGPRTIGLDGGYVYGRSLWAYCVQEDRILEIPNREPGSAGPS